MYSAISNISNMYMKVATIKIAFYLNNFKHYY